MSTYSVFNVYGVVPQTRPSKIPFLRDSLLDKNQVFLAVTETWLSEDHHLPAEVEISGYKIYRSDRIRKKAKKGRLSGGVCLYLRDDYAASFKPTVQFSNGVVEILVVYSKAKNVGIVVVYRQPDQAEHRSTSSHFKEAMDEVSSFVSSLKSPLPNLIFCGDFNLPHASWDGSSNSVSIPKEEKHILSIINQISTELTLSQHITEPTHCKGNTLDLVFSNNDMFCHSYKCFDVPKEVSDHKLIEISTSFNFDTDKMQHLSAPLKGLFKYNFFDESIDWTSIEEDFSLIDWDAEYNHLDVDSMTEKLLQVTESICSKHVPLKPSSTTSKEQTKIPRHRKVLMRRRRKLNSQLNNLCISSVRKENIKKQLIAVERDLMKSRAESKYYHEQKAVDSIKKNSKFFFSYVNKLSKTASKVGPLCADEVHYVSDPKGMAEILSNQFKSVFSPQREALLSVSELFPSENGSTTQNCNITDIVLTIEKIINAVKELRPTSAPGPDGFPAVLLKKCASVIAYPLLLLYRKSFDEGTVPQSFKRSNITPLFKSGNRGLAENYRPVALTSHLSKIFEKIIRCQLLSFFEENSILNKNQHGFRKGRSCISQLLAHFEKIIEMLSNGNNVDVVYLDFSKAFDKLDFNTLLSKLKKYGVCGKLGRWLHSFLTGRKQFVTINGFMSSLCSVLSGVPQGSVLGPLLFLVFINDIDDDISHSFLSSFADDTRVGAAVNNLTDTQHLQDDLNKVYQWAESNNMCLNSSKFELLCYGKNFFEGSHNYSSSSGKLISPSTDVKDLGVMMSDSANFSCHINKVILTAKKLMSWALRSFQTRTVDFIVTTWKSIILPRIDYGSQLWNPSKTGDIQKLEMLQRYFLKNISGYQSLSYWSILKMLGLYSLQRRRERYRIIYIWSILEGLVPNPKPEQIYSKFNPRLGRTCFIPTIKPGCYQNLIRSSFAVHGATLFNSLPKEVRNLTNCDKNYFKRSLDNFLKTVPDEPQISGYTVFRRADTNSLLDMI